MAKIRISGDTSGYVELAAPAVAGSDTITISSKTVSNPVGALMPFAGSTAPDGWLLCYGQEIAEASYPELFAVIGSTYNTGSESPGNFRVPDLRGRVIAGVDNMGGTAASRLTSTTITGGGDAPGEVGGAETHTLTHQESGVPAHGHGSTGGMSANESHTHSNATTSNPATGGTGYDGSLFGYGRNSDQASRAVTISSTNVAHTHTVTNNTAANAANAHNNVQPTMVLNYIICAGV